MNSQNLMNQYQGMQLKSDVDAANPHKLVSLLLNGALQNLVAAKSQAEQGVVAARGEMVGRAMSILEYLRVSLDPGSDLDFSERLADLYQYMEARLLDSSIQNDVEPIAEVIELLKPLRDGWDAIPAEYRG